MSELSVTGAGTRDGLLGEHSRGLRDAMRGINKVAAASILSSPLVLLLSYISFLFFKFSLSYFPFPFISPPHYSSSALRTQCLGINVPFVLHLWWNSSNISTLRTGLLNCLNARSRGLTFRHRASCL